MKQVISSVNGWVNEITEFLQGLIVLGVVIGILFNDYFGVIGELAISWDKLEKMVLQV